MTLKGHFDGTGIVLDGPVPQDILPDTPVRVVFDRDESDDPLSEIAALAIDGGMPADFAEQHEHYVKGTPRR